MEKILLGADAWGVDLKNDIKEHLKEKGYEVIDIGTKNSKKNIPYYEIAATAAKKVQKGEIPGSKIGRGWRFQKAIIDRWLSEEKAVTKIKNNQSMLF